MARAISSHRMKEKTRSCGGGGGVFFALLEGPTGNCEQRIAEQNAKCGHRRQQAEQEEGGK